MKLSRRSFVQAGAVGSLLAGSSVSAMATDTPTLVIYDSRIAQARAFAEAHTAPKLDIARQHGLRWRDVRASLPAGRIIGLTRWSDFVMVRGIAGEQGRRVLTERAVDALRLWELG